MTSKPTCQTRGCMREATCLGAYEGAVESTYACDGCCGHGNEDGRCESVEAIHEREHAAEINSLREQVRTLTAERDEAGRLLGQVIALRCVDTWAGEVPSGVAEHAAVDAMLTTMRERDALGARVAELEDDLSIKTAKHIRCSEAWEAAARERDSSYERVAELESHRDDVAQEVGEALRMLGHRPGENLLDTATRVAKEATTMRQRVSELASELDVERAMRLERETLLAGAREREEIAQAAVAQAVRERAAARDAALEEAKQELTRLDVRGVPWMFSGILALLDRLKAQPSRRFVEAERVHEVVLSLCDTCGGRGDYLPSCSWCRDSTHDHECPGRKTCRHLPLRAALERLGLSLDEVKP